MKKAAAIILFFVITGIFIKLHFYQLVPLVVVPVILGYVCFLQYQIFGEKDMSVRRKKEKAMKKAIRGLLAVCILGFGVLFVVFGVLAE